MCLHFLVKILLKGQAYEMSKVALNKPAPEFELDDYHGQPVALADFHGTKNVVLVFNRGFV